MTGRNVEESLDVPALEFSGSREPQIATDERCTICADGDLTPAFPSVEPGFEIRRCANCGSGVTWPPVPSDEIGAFYPEMYYGKENARFNPVMEYLTRLFRKRRAGVIASQVSPGLVLDVGCGRGLMLNQLREKGFEPYGVEFSDTAAWHARNRLDLPVWTGSLADSPHSPNSFRATIFWHSLEHLADPKAAVRRAHQLLQPEGLLVIAVPNFASLQARLFGGNWFHLDVPRHYHHFSLRGLQTLLTEAGFRVVKVDHFSFEQNPYGWIQSALNSLGFEFNFLYSILKDRSARAFRRRGRLPALLGTALAVPFLLIFAAVMTVFEAAVRKGGTVEVYALKN